MGFSRQFSLRGYHRFHDRIWKYCTADNSGESDSYSIWLSWVFWWNPILQPDILDDDDNLDLDKWKPSVYWVMLFLSLVCCTVACCAAAVYVPFEDWKYSDALYFCFVSFATIGFGDFVSTQKLHYPYVHWYRFANFVFLLIGCCCTYSLLNVTSIVIKQGLNYIIQKIQCRNQEMAAHHLPRRKSSVSTIYFSKKRGTRIAVRESFKVDHSEIPRRMSGELISMQDFFSANKVSLTVMQKELHEMAQVEKGGGLNTTVSNAVVLKPDAVGPLAIVSEKFKSKVSRHGKKLSTYRKK